MPKFYRQNKKRIDPRYFLNETILKEQDSSIVDIITRNKKDFCSSKDILLTAVKLLPTETTTEAILAKLPEGSAAVPGIKGFISFCVEAYKTDKNIESTVSMALNTVCGITLQEQKQEYTSAQGQAPYTDGNMKTSVSAAKRRAIKALRAKGAKGPIKFYKPHPKSGYVRGDKVVVTAYVGEPELDSYGKPKDDSRYGYSPTERAKKEGEKFLEKVKDNPGYKDNEYVQDMEKWFGTPEKWHSFITGAKALDQAPRAQEEFGRLHADLKQLGDTARRAMGRGNKTNWFDDLRDWISNNPRNREAEWAFENGKKVRAQLNKLKIAAGLASKIGYRVTLFSRDKSGLPGESERDVMKSADRAAKGEKARLSGKTRPGRGYDISKCRIKKKCRCIWWKFRFPGAEKLRRWPGVEKIGAKNREAMDERMQEILKMLSVVISKQEVNKPNTRGALVGLDNDALKRWPYSCQQSTMRLIAKFQKGHGLKCDACIGPSTYKKLKQVYDDTMNA